ncbi:hypothetical protein [Haloprofundus marisrubri]|nr:hypothetical protein [Haloprofundus marisrubri]
MALYGSAQHDSDVPSDGRPDRLYGSPQHESMSGPYPCSGSELARPTVVAEFDDEPGRDTDGGRTAEEPERATRNVSVSS